MMYRTRILILFIGFGLLGGCATPQEAGTENPRALCDRLAMDAVATESLDEARQMATRAAECYEDLQGQRR